MINGKIFQNFFFIFWNFTFQNEENFLNVIKKKRKEREREKCWRSLAEPSSFFTCYLYKKMWSFMCFMWWISIRLSSSINCKMNANHIDAIYWVSCTCTINNYWSWFREFFFPHAQLIFLRFYGEIFQLFRMCYWFLKKMGIFFNPTDFFLFFENEFHKYFHFIFFENGF